MAIILIVLHYARTLINSRSEMIKKMIRLGHEVVALGREKE